MYTHEIVKHVSMISFRLKDILTLSEKLERNKLLSQPKSLSVGFIQMVVPQAEILLAFCYCCDKLCFSVRGILNGNLSHTIDVNKILIKVYFKYVLPSHCVEPKCLNRIILLGLFKFTFK